MPTFEELVGSEAGMRTYRSLAYWIGVLKVEAPVAGLKTEALVDAMTMFYDVEEQNFRDEYGEVDEFTDAYFTPMAPVTLTRKWCPFDSARKWLGDPKWEEVTHEGFLDSVAALWTQPEYDLLDSVPAFSEDEAHFRFLLRLAVHRGVQRGDNILLICRPGWCFEHAVKNPLLDFGYSALEAGRLYPERVPSGSFENASPITPVPAAF